MPGSGGAVHPDVFLRALVAYGGAQVAHWLPMLNPAAQLNP
jgi:hypothetical protein